MRTLLSVVTAAVALLCVEPVLAGHNNGHGGSSHGGNWSHGYGGRYYGGNWGRGYCGGGYYRGYYGGYYAPFVAPAISLGFYSAAAPYYGAPYYGYGDAYYPGPGYYGTGYPSRVYAGRMIGAPGSVAVNVQIALQRRGYYRGAIDGVIGPQSRNAIAAFQRAEGLAVTGTIDRQVVRALGVG